MSVAVAYRRPGRRPVGSEPPPEPVAKALMDERGIAADILAMVDRLHAAVRNGDEAETRAHVKAVALAWQTVTEGA